MHHRFNLFSHIIVLVTQLKSGGTFTKLCVDLVYQMLYFFFAIFKFIAIMVTNDIGYSTLLYIPLDTDKMIESFVSGSMFRSFMPGKHGDELVGYANRVNHFMFRIARMYITSLKNDFGSSGIKVFKL